MRRAALSLALAALAALALAPAAAAQFAIEDFDVTFTDRFGDPVAQAGAHPFEMTTSFKVKTAETESGGVRLEEAVKDLIARQVPGFVGNPTAVPPCSTADFLTAIVAPGGFNVPDCPDSSAVGTVAVRAVASEKLPEDAIHSAVYNLAPPPGRAAKLGFWNGGVPVTIELGVEEEFPNRISGGPTNVSQIIEVAGAELVLWGDPSDEAHDPLRGICLDASGESIGECEANLSPKPFLTMPRSCEGPLETEWEADSWPNPGAWISGSVLTHDSVGEPLGMSGCGRLGFAPEVTAAPTSAAAGSPSGIEFSIDVTDEGLANPAGIAAADIASIVTVLPTGVTANPGAAEGLGVCPLAAFEAESLEGRFCPPASKLGTVEATTPLLEEKVLRGSVYLASQYDNPFGSLLGLYLVIREPRLGVFVKTPVRVDTDPASGRIVTTVAQIPPFPLSSVDLSLRSGPRAPLLTPPTCGTYAIETLLYPSSGAPPASVSSPFAVSSGPGGSPCPPPGAPAFAPGFEAGSLNNAAGAFSPFSMRLTRGDAQQGITRLSAVLPPGVSGKVAGVPACPDAAIVAARQKSGRAELAAPSCPPTSRLGSVLAAAGAGAALTHVPGSLYLAGPFAGAPLSVAAIVPAVAGPFDVGTVVTRVALRLNPNDARVEVDGAASDSIPHILEGIPLALRELRILTDRPGFTLNPTSCSESATQATIGGSGANPFNPADDTAVLLGSRYQAAGCAALGFKPKLRLRLKGATKRAKNPGFRAELKTRGGDANLRGAIVNLPPSQFIDNAHISNPCTRVQFNANNCPKASILGRGRAFTPLLDAPLEGNVYFRSNGGERKLPDLVVALKGQFEFNLVIAVLEAKKGRVRTKVLNAPDVPVERFVLNMFSGKRSLLQNSEWLCKKKQRAYLNLIGQNGRRDKSKPVVKTACSKRGKKKSRARAHSRAR